MTTILYFVTPRSLVKIGSKAAEFIPVLGPALDFTKKAKKVTEMADPISASSRGIGMMFNFFLVKLKIVKNYINILLIIEKVYYDIFNKYCNWGWFKLSSYL